MYQNEKSLQFSGIVTISVESQFKKKNYNMSQDRSHFLRVRLKYIYILILLGCSSLEAGFIFVFFVLLQLLDALTSTVFFFSCSADGGQMLLSSLITK